VAAPFPGARPETRMGEPRERLSVVLHHSKPSNSSTAGARHCPGLVVMSVNVPNATKAA